MAGPANSFIAIPKNSLGNNIPSLSLYIRKDHPILLNGKEVLPEKLQLNYSRVLKKNLKKKSVIYSLCTEERTFVKMNNVDVATWGKKDWETRVAKLGTKFSKQ